MRNFLFCGNAGTGKTMGAQAIAAGLNLPYTLMTCSANTEVTDLVGQFISDTSGFRGEQQHEGEFPKISDSIPLRFFCDEHSSGLQCLSESLPVDIVRKIV